MKARNVFGWMLSVMLLLLLAGSGLTAGSGLARGPQSIAPSGVDGASATSAANAVWFRTEVDTTNETGQHTSVAIDPATGDIYVSYYDADAKDLRIAQYVGSGGDCGPDFSWLCHTVDSEGDVGKYSSIAIMPGAGLTRITYHDATNGDLKIAKSSYPPDIYWSTYTIDKGISPISTGLYTSLKLVPVYGTNYVSYYSSNPSGVDELRIAYRVSSGGNCGYDNDAGQWQCDIVQSGEGLGQYTSLALDGNNDAHIAYYDGGNGDLWYATSASGTNCGPGGNTWTCYPVSGSSADVGQYASIYVDDGNYFHIAYYNATADTLMYATKVDSVGNCGVFGSAQCDEIDAMQADYHSLGVSMAEDPDGYPIIAYQAKNGSLNLARPVAALGLSGGGGNCGPENLFYTWYCETIDPHGRWIYYRNGDYVSIALNSAGLATIAYNGFIMPSEGNLVVASQRLQNFLPLVVKNQ